MSHFLRKPRSGRRTAEDKAIEAQLAELERLSLAGEAAALRTASLNLLKRVLDSWSEARVRYYLGRAQMDLSQPDLALDNFRRARLVFEEKGDQWMVVDCLDWEAGSLYVQERPEAIEVAQRALSACRNLSPVPPAVEAHILGHLGAIHVSRHEWAKAIGLYEEAVAVAGAVRDLSRVARMYSDLSVAYQEIGDLGSAAQYSQKALAIHTMLRDRESLALAQNNLGLVLLRQGRPDQAEKHLADSLAGFEQLGLERGKSHVLLSLGELCLDQGRSEEAHAYFAAAVELAERLHENMTAGLAHQFLGRLAEARGDHQRSDAEFEAALRVLEPIDAPERLLECHREYAEILTNRGRQDQAIEHWRKAVAQSKLAAGHR
jgi:tetratricopeptide (TPR) repeat protein